MNNMKAKNVPKNLLASLIVVKTMKRDKINKKASKITIFGLFKYTRDLKNVFFYTFFVPSLFLKNVELK